MHPALRVTARELEQAASDADYLQVILDRYNRLWQAEPDRMTELFNDRQISLLVYGILCDQVRNGGFLQLLFNGYAEPVFRSPLVQSLREWGADALAALLESIANRCLAVAGELASRERSLEALSRSYHDYPEFGEYDKRLETADGAAEIRAYVSAHLSDFILVA